MPTQEQVQQLVQSGLSYDQVASRLGVTPGLAYLIGTGLPADGSDAPSARTQERTGFLTSSQHLASSRSAENPTQHESVLAWIRARAADDPAMQAAAQQQETEN